MQIHIPNPVAFIMNRLEKEGYCAYVVGGCVRDSILGKTPTDWDIATNAKPEEVQDLFEYTIPTGTKYGTTTVRIDQQSFEVTTFRKDGCYLGNRKPERVFFTDSIHEDLARRDFTINAMAYHERKGLLDLFGGRKDLEKRLIRSVGNPQKRFEEDALRMLRGIRFAAQLEFDIEPDTEQGILKKNFLLQNVSPERIREEFNKIFLAQSPSLGIQKMIDLGLLPYILPEFSNAAGFQSDGFKCSQDGLEYLLTVVDAVEPDIVLRLAAFLNGLIKQKRFFSFEENRLCRNGDDAAEIAEKILKHLKYDKKTIAQVRILIEKQLSKEQLLRVDCLRQRDIKYFINDVGKENLERWFQFQTVDMKACQMFAELQKLATLKEQVDKILKENHPLERRDLKINGEDLIRLGYPRGPQIGKILADLMEQVLEDPAVNTKERLIALAMSNQKIDKPD